MGEKSYIKVIFLNYKEIKSFDFEIHIYIC